MIQFEEKLGFLEVPLKVGRGGEMVKVRKIPVVVDAERTKSDRYIETLEGTMKASAGDWIITGVDGEKYPVKPDIFKKTYEIIGG